MTVRPDTAGTCRSAAPSSTAATGSQTVDSPSARLEGEVVARLPGGGTRFVACAPGRLDVLGGSAEYTGSLIVSMPIARRACVGVQRRPDARIQITETGSPERDNGSATVTAKTALLEAAEADRDRGRIQAVLGAVRGRAPKCVLGTLAEALHSGLIPRFDGGLSIVVGTTLDELADVGADAAVAAATLVALAGAFDVSVPSPEAVAVCQRVENLWLGVPVGIGDAACALLGEPGTLTPVQGTPFTDLPGRLPARARLTASVRNQAGRQTEGQPIHLPPDLALIGIDSGISHPDAVARYSRVRTAAFMGRALIDRILQYEGSEGLASDGCLACVSVSDYVERFRDRIPTKLKGAEYLERFGETGDPLTRVDPDLVYKVRSRTEHHIYEHMRACRFVQCLRRFGVGADPRAIREAGELMYASHWSYGQRCGLGSIETDLLVNLIRDHGAQADIYGAKITGRGCGGTVAVLMRAADRAWEAIATVIAAYTSQTKHQARLVRGSSPGALMAGVRKIASR